MVLPVLDLCAEEDASNANSHIAEFNEIQWERVGVGGWHRQKQPLWMIRYET